MAIDPDDPRTWPASARELYRRRERATVGNPHLARLLCERIAREGPIPFAEFMRLALYHPTHGYYATAPAPFSREGDFLTSPETHPAFGALVCRWLAGLWEEQGCPRRFDLVEVGAGRGTLASQILATAAERFPGLHTSLRYTLVEHHSRPPAEQTHAPRLRWVHDLEVLGPVRGCILSNELLDALPVHRVQMTPQGLREVYVGCRDGELVDVLDVPSTPALAAHLAWVGAALPVGAQGEIGLEAVAWYRRAARCLAEGALLTIDYGHRAPELYSPQRPCGTLLCYYRHTANEEPYRRLGTQDITAHVDFTALERAGEAEGLRTRCYTTQQEWLRSLGIADYLAGAPPETRDDLLALVDPERLGRLKVLLQQRGP
ncbi:MAG: SAM-dependent methyltransferase [Armatimonadetes bacterium]|nr:SAM-dependent methyltransferase [Armatimonadota bacterium]